MNNSDLNTKIKAIIETVDDLQSELDELILHDSGHGYLQDLLFVAQRNLSATAMKLQVASDITEKF